MNNFIYDTPTKIYFGKGEENKIGHIIKELKVNNVLIHFGSERIKENGLLDKVIRLLEEENIKYTLLGGVRANPELSLVRKGIEICQKQNIDFILAIGGGSVLDSSKAIANGYANPSKDVWDFFLGKDSPTATVKKGCILTISAAGSEMSNSCVISNDETKEKRGYCSPFNHFDFAIENPELTYTVSPYQTACGAVDIAMHTIERYFDLGEDTYLTDSIAEAIIRSAMKAGLNSYNNPMDYNARANMMWASSLAHNGLTHCGREFLLTVHQLEHELSALYPNIAHGAGLAALWCSWARYVYEYNIPRWKQYSLNVMGIDPNGKDDNTLINEAINLQENYYKSIGMPTSLKELDVKDIDLEYLANKCSRNKTRVISGYKPLAYEDILAIYKMAY